MSVLSKLRFAAQNPGITYRFVERELIRRVRKQQANPAHRPTAQKGQVCSTHFFDAANFSSYTHTDAADSILSGKLCLYGKKQFGVGKSINWHTDYLSEFTWPADTFALDILYKYPVGTDIKNPWEVSRAHHLVTVGMTYQATKNETYAAYIVETITDWIEKNPFYLGVNWKVAMEVGIRASNWLLAYDLISGSAAVTPEFTALFLGSMAEHARYIMENLEYFGVRSNHYLSDLIGLLWIGTLCPSLSGAQHWQTFAHKELEVEILHQFHEDGIHFEASTSYQRLVLELIGYTTLLLKKYDLTLSQAAATRLQAGFEALSALTGPDGKIPQIGDNDSGRMFIFANYHDWAALDMTYMRDLGHLLFPEIPAAGTSEFSWCIKEKRASPLPKNQSFPQGGITVVNHKEWHLVIAQAPIGQDGNGGHNHDDSSSFELCYGSTRIIVDPGTGCYTSNPEVRNRFRSADLHNAPTITGQVHALPSLLFVGDQFSTSSTSSKEENTWELSLVAEKYTCSRTINLKDSGIFITDSRVTPETGALQTFLTFPPDLHVKKEKAGFALGNALILQIQAGEAELIASEYSPSYALIEPTAAIRITAPSTLSFSITKR